MYTSENKKRKFDFGVIIFSSPGLCPWRAYVVTQALASASALAVCLSF